MDEQQKTNENEKPKETVEKNGFEELSVNDDKLVKETLDEEQKRINEKSITEDKHFKKVGFYCVLLPTLNPLKNFTNVLKEIKNEFQQRIDSLNKYLEDSRNRNLMKVKNIEEKLKAEKIKLAKLLKENGGLGKKRELILKELKNIKNKIFKEFEKLAEAKKSLIDNILKTRLDEIGIEINKVIETYHLVGEKKSEINKKIFSDNKDVFDKKVKRFESLRSQTENAYNIIRKKIDELIDSDFTDNLYRFLIYISSISLIASGWFFSLFISDKKLESEDYKTFIVGRLFRFMSDLFLQENKLAGFGILLAGFIGILALITFVIWGTDWFIRRKAKSANSNGDFLFFIDENGFVRFLASYSNSMLVSWLNLLPTLLISGIIILVLSIPAQNSPDPNILFNSLYGQFIGCTIVLALTGLMFFYSGRVIEPRRIIEEGRPRTFKRLMVDNWELVLILFLFILLLVTTIAFHKEMTKSTLSLLWFMFMALSTAFTLAHGLIYRGLVKTEDIIENKIKVLSKAAEDNARSKFLDIRLIESNDFKNKVDFLMNQFLEMIAIRNVLAKEILQDQVKRPSSLEFIFNTIFGIKQDYIHDKVRDLSAVEEKHFPEHTRIIEELKSEWSRVKIKYDEIENEIKQLKEGKSKSESQIMTEILSLENKIDNYKKDISKIEAGIAEQIQEIGNSEQKAQTDVTYGYNLGLWYLKNNLNSSNFILNELPPSKSIKK